MQAASTSVVTTAASREEQRRRAKMDFSNVSLRIKVVNSVTGKTSLDTKLPAQWMASVADVVPQLVRICSMYSAQLSIYFHRKESVVMKLLHEERHKGTKPQRHSYVQSYPTL